ncbi:MAG: 50S ribosomal protein L23 [Candidatus Omnitrophica bacterium]|nr:50S ribosomal protein L23 [Candidatus Omnitrophota bacterium]
MTIAPTEIIKRVLQTEKGTRLAKDDQYLLNVAVSANKVEIRRAVEALFQVKVQQVNTHIGHGKWRRLSTRAGRRPDWKRAIVTVGKGQKIEVKT